MGRFGIFALFSLAPSAFLLAFFLLFLPLSPAFAQNETEREELRTLFVEGRQAALRKQYAEAQTKFLRAIELLQTLQKKAQGAKEKTPLIRSETRFSFLLAQTYKDQGRFEAAYLAFLRSLKSDSDPSLRKKALQEIEQLDGQGHRLEVLVEIASEPPGISFQIQHEFGPLIQAKTPWTGKLWPGQIRLEASFPPTDSHPGETRKERLLLRTGQPLRKTLALTPVSLAPSSRPLRPSPPLSPSRPRFPSRTTAWIVLGSGIGLLAITTGLGIAAAVQRGFAEGSLGKLETPQVLAANNDLISLEAGTFVLLGVSLAILTTGGIFFALSLSPPAKAPEPRSSASPTLPLVASPLLRVE